MQSHFLVDLFLWTKEKTIVLEECASDN